MTTPDVGGGFGIKGCNYPEYFAVAFAARELGRPVHWMSTRGEAMLSDNGGRDHVTVAEAAFDADYAAAGDPHRLRLEPRRLQRALRPARSPRSWR